MANIIIPPGWAIDPRRATPEKDYLEFQSRRRFLKHGIGSAAGLTLGGALAACSQNEHEIAAQATNAAPAAGNPLGGAGAATAASAAKGSKGEATLGLYPAPRNPKYTIDPRKLTEEDVAARYNNYYEFTTDKEGVWKVAKDYDPGPWSVELAGLCEKPAVLDLDELRKVAPLEERLYRFRCVEAWSMAVPWVGYPLSKLIELAKPKPEAKFVRFVSKLDKTMPGVKSQAWYKWPYYEGLSMAEAMNELTLLCTGIYGHPLPNQHGAPVRIITPWKYGYKSPKGVAKIEFVAEQPPTFWNDLAPIEYDFSSNVNPTIPHPRWTQASERVIPTGERVETMMFNGYGDYVENLYKS